MLSFHQIRFVVSCSFLICFGHIFLKRLCLRNKIIIIMIVIHLVVQIFIERYICFQMTQPVYLPLFKTIKLTLHQLMQCWWWGTWVNPCVNIIIYHRMEKKKTETWYTFLFFIFSYMGILGMCALIHSLYSFISWTIAWDKQALL